MARSYTVAQTLLDCVCTALASQGWEGECCVVYGEQTFDACCESGGQAWVKVIRRYPSSTFPQENSGADVNQCATPWTVVIEVGAVRCVECDMCDCDAKQRNALVLENDAEAMLQGLVCCFQSVACSSLDFKIFGLDPVESGGCAGSVATVAVRDQVCCPE